ncbi:MAG TPA: hydroxymethylglutaryl-CoA lyase [Micropepsaceae bacterium]|nr:hydroxymethylglutaryl-CoA lyase [Micropepsaceae bacterium]
MQLPKTVTLVEVGPRDGLQNEPATVPTAVKVELVDRLSASGLKVIEAGAFVSPKWVPQMADTADVLAKIKRAPGVRYPVLVPNLQGFVAAKAAGARKIAIFAAASETFSRMNINCSIAESLARFDPVATAAQTSGIAMRGYISCAVWCPFEGRIAAGAVAHLTEKLLALGCYEISLGDTIGKATPLEVQQLIDTVVARVPRGKLAGHFHDTYGQALANVLASLERGIAVFDSSVAGLGGCPYAPGATGNVASEDVLYMLNGLGIETDVDWNALAEAGRFISAALNRPLGAKSSLAMSRSHPKQAGSP